MAGEPRDARDDDDGTDVPLDDDADGGGDDKEPTVDDLQQKIRDLEGSLRKANRERARLGRQVKPAAPAGKPATGDDKPAPEITPEKLVELENATKEAKRWRSSTIQEKAKLALAAEGVDAKRVARIVRLIDEEDLDVDADGKLIGIQEQIDELKDEWPEFFAKPKQDADDEPEAKPKRPVRDRRASRDAGDKAAAGSPQKSIAEQRAERVLGLTSR